LAHHAGVFASFGICVAGLARARIREARLLARKEALRADFCAHGLSGDARHDHRENNQGTITHDTLLLVRCLKARTSSLESGLNSSLMPRQRAR
jgi:hypothetical protein